MYLVEKYTSSNKIMIIIILVYSFSWKINYLNNDKLSKNNKFLKQ